MAKLVLKDVVKRFGDVTIVHGFNLEIDDEEFIVLVGPSGCGKSTTLRMIAGLEEITSGELQIDGKSMNHVAPKDRDIAMVFQSYALYPHMSVYDNMAFGLQLRKFPKDEIDRRVQEAAQILGLTTYLERKPRALSGGQRQRVAMGRAIVRKPRVFLFDEPLSNLDAKLRVAMRAEIAKVHRRMNATSIYVTHDQTEAMTLADRIVVMKDGRVMQVGAPMELYRHPDNLFVAGFIGSPSMNFLKAEVRGARISGPGFSLPLPPGVPTLPDGTEVMFGVRPEHLHVGSAGAGEMRARVEVIEPLGAESYVHFDVSGVSFTARLSPDTPVKLGEEVHLGVDLAHCHLFDVKTEKVLRT